MLRNEDLFVIDTNLIVAVLGIIGTLVGIGWKLGSYLTQITASVARIEALLAHTSARLDRLEIEVNEIKKELRWDHNEYKSKP
jgi:hypothetical protein